MQAYIRPLTAERERALAAGAAGCVADATPARCTFRECTAEQDKDLCPKMIVVPAGSFMMGSNEKEGEPDELPQHPVTIAQPFAVATIELTFDEWNTCVQYGDCAKAVNSGFGEKQQPVINVSWADARRYVAWLSTMTGKTYRLLTEAEYEYATRAVTETTATETAYPWGNDIKLNGKAMANCRGCGSEWDGKHTAPVGTFSPNKFGLYDMVGNVFEWVKDCYHPDYSDAPGDGSDWTAGCSDKRVLRGGSWDSTPEFLRSASRWRFTTDYRISVLGFRAARRLVTP
jgi:formylglycine-generating enzyme required for sulfatase activity